MTDLRILFVGPYVDGAGEGERWKEKQQVIGEQEERLSGAPLKSHGAPML